MNDLIERQAAIDAFDGVKVDEENCTEYDIGYNDGIDFAISKLSVLPSAQPEIIRCNSCKYWTQTTGNMKGYGLGRCDFHDADLVTCQGFCYWAERRTDG